MNFPSWPTLCLALLFLPFVLSLISPTCKPQEEVLFTEDPTDPQAFLSCKPYASSPSIGFWERHFCPNDMHFESGTQQCTANSLPPNMVREANDILQIAILNGTCSRGEQCIGGTLCDPVHQRCLCPSGTVAILETLSCAKLTPLSQQSVYSSQQQQFWRAPFGSYPQYPQGQQIPSQVPPGSSCERGEACGGGSVCMRQMGICLCPAHTENQNGQCVPLAIKSGDGLQSAKELIGQGGFFKIPLGEQCNEYLGLFCADQSAICGNGRCQCVPPMLERDGHCQMPPSREAGPGELCNADRVCTRGSVCNRQMPICVCPEGTILDNGWCVANQQQQKATATSSAPMIPIGERSQPIVGPRQKEAQVGEKCSLNADCASGAYCNGNSQPPTCQCLSTHVNVNNHCEKVIYPGEKGCETDLQCSAGYAGARCINGLCICPPGSTAIDQTCIPAIAWPGEACNISRLMPVCSADSYCFGGRCVCNPPLSLFQKQCIKRSEEIRRDEDQREGRRRRECGRHSECPRGGHCSAKGRCELCAEEETMLGGMCVHLEDFGGKFGGGGEFFHDGGGEAKEGGRGKWTRTNGTSEGIGPKGGRDGAKMGSGIDQIFSALSMLRKAALDGLINRKRQQAPWKDQRAAGNIAAPISRRQRRNIGAAAGQINKEGKMKKKGEEDTEAEGGSIKLAHGHRLEGEPCSPGHICLNGTVCEDGHCSKCDMDSCHSSVPTFRQIGAKCQQQGLDRCVGGSICLNSGCSCTDGSSPDASNLRCRQKPGGRCSSGQLCSGRTECRLGVCQCRAGLRLDARVKKCTRAVALPGESCQNGEQCLGGSECGFGQICFCPPNQIVADGRRCDRKRQREDGMKKKEGRKLLFEAAADDAEGNGRERGAAPLVRLVTARPGQSCAHGQACTGGSVCRHGRICVCGPGEYVPEGGAGHVCVNREGMALQAMDRLVNSGPGQLCVKGGAKCVGGSKCQHGICQCPEGHTLFRGECLPPRAKMSPEKFRAQSLLFSPDFPFLDTPQMTVAGSPPAHPDENMQDPVPSRIVSPGAMCRLSLECPYRTECLRGVCRCQKGETIVNGVCRKTIHEVLPGGRCDTQKGLDCLGESHCFYGICVCLYGLVIVGHECANSDVLKRVPPGGNCAQGQQCEGRAKCVRGKCQCPRGQKPDSESRRCIKSIRMAAETEKPSDQAAATVPAHTETADTAASSASLIPLALPKFVYAIPAALAAAAEDGKFNQILTANQMSINLMDQQMLRSLLAPFGTIAKKLENGREGGCEGSTCFVTSPPILPASSSSSSPLLSQLFTTTEDPSEGIPGHSCTSHAQQCHGGALCMGGICVCRPGFRPSDGFCQIAKVGLGESCFINEQCKSSGFCIDGICRCRPDWDNPPPPFPSPASSSLPSHDRFLFHRHRCPLRPMAAVGEECSGGQSCAWNSVCGQFSGVCECAVGLEKNQGACVASRRPRGTECLSSSNCHKFGFCDNGFCICKSGHQPVGAFCLPPARLVVDDPKAYVDPDLMAALLKKQGIAQSLGPAGNPTNQNGPFGMRMAKLGTAAGIAGGWRTGGGGDEGRTGEEEGMEPNFGWPFQIGNGHGLAQSEEGSGHQRRQGGGPAMGLSPPMGVQHFPMGHQRAAKGVKTMSMEEKRQLLMRTSAGKVRQPAAHRKERGMAMPGEFCGNRERICLGNSICLAGWCQCPDGVHVERGGMCAIDPGKEAAPESHFLPVPSHSPMKLHAGRSPHHPWQSCANGPCIHGANCVRSPALPAVQKLGPFCQCAPGTIFIGGECVPRKPEMRILPIGSHCPQPAICDFGSFCGPKGICQCPEGQKPISNICVQIALPGESCAHGEFCSDGAVCAPGLDACVCPVGWKVRQGKCHRGRKKMAKLAQRKRGHRPTKIEAEEEEEGAIVFTEMPPNSMESMTSQAPTTKTATARTMAPISVPRILVPLGEVCHSDKDCQGVAKAYCPTHSRRCTCLPGFGQLYSSVCVPEDRIRFPGEECVASAHFCSGNSWCKEGQCQCFQRDSLAFNGRCQRVPGVTNSKAIRRHPAKPALPGECHSDFDCPLGANCHQGGCLCNGRHLLVQKKKRDDDKDVSERECVVDLDCPPMLECLKGRCVCIGRSAEAEEKAGEGGGGGEAEADIELDYALGEPVGSPILPGTFCDAFSRCGQGAECFFGRCQCIFRGEKLAFVNGTTKCVEEAGEGEGEQRVGRRPRAFHRETEIAPELAMLEDGPNLDVIKSGREKGGSACGEEQGGRKEEGTTEGCGGGHGRIIEGARPDRPKSSDPLLSTQQNCTFRPSLCSGGSICIAGRCECPDGKKQKKGRNTECQGAEMEEEEREKGPFASEQQKLQQQQQRAPQHAPPPTRTTPMSQKLASPGTQCGPLDICTGGSSCVEGICLCPAGTRPSLHANDCETFGQRKSDEASNGGMRRNDEEEEEMKEADTRPRPIKANQKTASSMTTSATVKSPPPSTTPAPPPQPASQLIANNANSSSTEIDKPPTLPAVSPNPVTPSNCSSGGGRCARSCSPPEDGGLQDCPNLASSPNMTSVNGTKKSQRRPYARPSESCANREICTGGSVCQRQTKVCECPSKKPLLRNHICIQSDEQRRPSEAGPGEMCNAETQCLGETICVDGMCRCRDGLGAEGGKCPRALSSNDDGGRQTSQRSAVPAELAIQSPPQEMLPPVKLATESETGEESGKQESDADSSAAPIRSSSRPRISGPPLRKISSSSSSSTSIGGRQVAPEGTTGVCPPGNVPTTDPSTGHLLICNGMTPNCPPKSYCFVTVVFALPGESCRSGEICLGGALCDWADRKCICAAGHLPLGGICTRKETIAQRELGDFVAEKHRPMSKSAKRRSFSPKLLPSVSAIDGRRPRGGRAQPCPLPEHPEQCQLPDCFCSKDGRSPPPIIGHHHPLKREAIPQFVVLTFDDAINGRTMRDFFALFGSDNFRNPNGCPVKATFFVSHEWTDYNEVERIAGSGHEIASNSITHECLKGANTQRWVDEMEGQRHILATLGNVPREKIVGMRAPQLTLGGDCQFEAMERSNFLYDNTASIDGDGPPFWPQTLDYRLAWPCDEGINCPERSFPSIWEVPLNQFHSPGGPQRSAMLRGAIQANASSSGDAIQRLLLSHFERAYRTNRAPFVLTLNADFLQIGGGQGIRGLIGFMNTLMDQFNEDVYFLTMRGLIEWMRKPVPLGEMSQFRWIQCGGQEEDGEEEEMENGNNNGKGNDWRGKTCEQPNSCIYPTPGLASAEHQLLTCSPCPMMFPWIGNPLGILKK